MNTYLFYNLGNALVTDKHIIASSLSEACNQIWGCGNYQIKSNGLIRAENTEFEVLEDFE